MQYEMVFKSDRMFMLYLPSSKFSYCCLKGSEEGGSRYPSDGSMSTHVTSKHGPHRHIHANKGKR
jgi:hypothetical protein